MVLVNGCQGIGTGWSTHIPCYNPRDLATYIMEKLQGGDEAPQTELHPWYKHFRGRIEKKGRDSNNYIMTGVAD